MSSELSTLLRRQSPGFEFSDYPSKCKSKCDVLQEITTCQTLSCACSDAVSSRLTLCLDCIVANSKDTGTGEAQTSMDIYVGQCAQAGIKVAAGIISSFLGSARPTCLVVTYSLSSFGCITGLLLILWSNNCIWNWELANGHKGDFAKRNILWRSTSRPPFEPSLKGVASMTPAVLVLFAREVRK
ncbi:hypothetical protein C8J56DRAFT_896770 [Mycena floridula]|nr:hypothetical protein C8J56DRAFT_896770 [Mycena floridula]